MLKLFAAVGAAFLVSLQALGLTVKNYNYPEKDAYRATLAAGILKSEFHDLEAHGWGKPVEEIHGLAKPIEKDFDLYLKRRAIDTSINKVKYRFPITVYKRRGRAPLMVLIPGLGSLHNTDLAKYLAEKIYRMGYHVVIVPNTYSWRFAFSASRSGIIGDFAQDSEDMYRALRVVKRRMIQTYRVKISSFNVMGYSAGGYTAVNLKAIDEQKGQLNIRKVLAINPPLNIRYAQRKIGTLERAPIPYTIVEVAIRAFTEILQFPVNMFTTKPTYVYEFYRQLSLTKEQAMRTVEIVLSDPVGQVSREAIYVYRNNRANNRSRIDYTFPNNVSNWEEYIRFILRPYLKERRRESGSRFQRRFQREKLVNYLRKIRDRQNVFILHNADDFLIRQKDLREVERLMPSRTVIFPHGGHVGNVWHPTNQQWIGRFLAVPNRHETKPLKVYRR